MRLLSLALLAAAFGHSSGTVDRTVQCTTQVTGGIPSYGIQAWPQTWSKPYWFPADAYVFTGAGWKLFWVHGASPGIRLDSDSCRTVRARVPLAAAGLPHVARFVLGDYPTVRVRCTLRGPIVVRFRVEQDGRGLPRTASVALRLARGNTPLAFLTWSWTSVSAWATPRCETTEPTQP